MSKISIITVSLLIVIISIVAIISYIQATQPPPLPQPTATPSSATPTPTAPIPTPTPTDSTPTPTPELNEQEQIRDLAMNYIKTNHPETAQFMNSLVWTGGRATENIVGAEKYIYFAGGWNFTLTYPVVPQPIYTLTADYKAPGVGIPYRVIWQGTYQNQAIDETSYVFAQ